jgi:hypothetical protein
MKLSFKINLAFSIRIVLILFLILVLAGEAYFAFTMIYLKTKVDQSTLRPPEVVRIDLKAYEKTRDNILQRQEVTENDPADFDIPRNNFFK